jgi:hypothetical protein
MGHPEEGSEETQSAARGKERTQQGGKEPGFLRKQRPERRLRMTVGVEGHLGTRMCFCAVCCYSLMSSLPRPPLGPVPAECPDSCGYRQCFKKIDKQ